MKISRFRLFILFLPVCICAQFSDGVVFGPAVNAHFSKDLSELRLSGRIRIPGDYIDAEADLVNFSTFLDRDAFRQYGVSWVSLLWIPPFIAGKKVPVLNGMSFVLMGINGVLNVSFGFGNSWIRGNLGWKNDVFIFRDFLWVFRPEIGCKISLPQKWMTDGALRLSVEFPAMAGSDTDFTRRVKSFRPRLTIGIDLLLFYADILVGGK